MNGEDMMRGMGEIWDSLIDEAEYETIEKKKGVNYMKYLASAAVYMTIAGAAIFGSIQFQEQNPLNLPAEQSSVVLTSEENVTETSVETIAEEASLLPLEADEYLAVTTEEKLVILNRDGKVVTELEGCRLDTYKMTGDTAVISGTKPLLLEYVSEACLNEEGIYSVEDEGWIYTGIYSIENQDWLLEPHYGNLILLSDHLCTNRDDKFTSGKLMKLDGTVIAEKAGNPLNNITRVGDFVSDGKNLYDLEGNYVVTFGSDAEVPSGKFGPTLGDVWEQYLLVSDDTVGDGRSLKLMTIAGETLWTETSGLTLKGHFGDLWSWTDANNVGLITDMKLNHILSESEFYQINAGKEINGGNMMLVSVNEENGERLIETSNTASREYWYYRCDASWKILEAYPKNRVYLEKEDTTIPWYWQVDETGTFTVKNIWTEESVSWEDAGVTAAQADEMADRVRIESEGAVVNTYYFANGTYHTSFDTFTGYHKLYENAEHFTYSLTKAEENLVIGRVSSGVFTITREISYFDSDGAYLGDSSNGTLYVNENMKCVQNGTDLNVLDTEGKLLLTLPLFEAK